MKRIKLFTVLTVLFLFNIMNYAQYTDTDLQNLINAAATGSTLILNSGTYTFSGAVNINKSITLQGNNTTFLVSGSGERVNILASGVTIQNIEFHKTDKTGVQNIVYIGASNTTIKNNNFHGQYAFGDGDVSRAMVVSGGLTGLLIEENTFYALRQPMYLSGPTTGNIINNFTDNTKGFVLEGGDINFSGNTWGTNVYDVAILGSAPSGAYLDIVAMSNANNNAVIEDQRVAPAVLSVVYVDASTSNSSDLGGKYHPYSTIAPAISRVVNGGKILVSAGTYEEQLTVNNKSVSIIGSGKENTFINSPAALSLSFSTSYPYKCIIAAINNSNLVVKDLTVNGLGRGNANNRFTGIGFRNSQGTVQNCKIQDIKDTPFSGVQHGVGIYSYNDDVVARNIYVINNEITGFQKTAIALNASDTNPLSVNVQGNEITGAGATNITAQNGIQTYGAQINGNIQSNSISGIGYSGTSWVATSILNFYSYISISSNTVTDGHVGIYNIDASANIANNNLSVKKIGDYGFGIIATDPPEAVPSPFGVEDISANIKNRVNGIESTDNVILNGNNITLTGGNNLYTYGIEADAGYGPNNISILATGNSISGFYVGIGVYRCESGCDVGTFSGINFNYNNILNNSIGFQTNLLTPVLAEYNWWGTTVESEIQSMVDGLVDFDPWIGKGIAISFSSMFRVKDANSTEGLTNLYFGQAPNATDGIDLSLFEEELPPLPPAGVFDARFILPAGNIGSHRDYRSDTKRFVKWTVRFQGVAPFTFTWDANSLPAGDFFLRDATGTLVNINMKSQNTFTLPISLDLNQLIIENAVYNCLPVDVVQDWNMVSLPFEPIDHSKTSIFPTSLSNAYGYNAGGYYVANELETKKAYWLYFDHNQTSVQCGVGVEDLIPVKAGWNMIGILDENVPKARITSIPSGIIPGSFFGYEAGYTVCDTLKVGKGYWVLSTADGFLKLHNILRKEDHVNPIKSDWANIIISDSKNKTMKLYLGDNNSNDNFELPPMPPAGAFDARFESNKMVEVLNETGLIINISTDNYPVTLKINGADITVQDAIEGTLLHSVLKSGSELIITDSRINKLRIKGTLTGEQALEYKLEQNYPNPFNPNTNIRFTVANESFVNLSIYNLLGEKIKELKNEVMKPGNYLIEFDATQFSSGVYIYKLQSGSSILSRKMILLK